MDIIAKLIENITEIFDLIRSNILTISASLALFSWAVILMPNLVFSYLHIFRLRSRYLHIVGAIVFISSFLVIITLTYRLLSLAYAYLRALFELPRLTPNERARLSDFVQADSRTIPFYLTDGVVSGLEKKGFIYKADSKPNSAGEQDYHIYSWILGRLKRNPEQFISNKPKSTQRGEDNLLQKTE